MTWAMTKTMRPNWQTRFLFIIIATTACMFAAIPVTVAQDENQTYNVSDKVEVQRAEGWLKGEVTAVDHSYGRPWYTIRYEWQGAKFEMFALPKDLRLIAAAPPAKHDAEEADKAHENQSGRENAPPPQARAATKAGKYKIGDRVECDVTESGQHFEKGTLVAFPKGDKFNGYAPESGYYYRVKLDRRAAGGSEIIVAAKTIPTALRPLAAGAPYKPETTKTPLGKVTVDENNTLSADRAILKCPVKQPRAKNGQRPNPELLKKVLRCELGEKPAAKGLDGAVTIDVTALQIGASRKWELLRDRDGGIPGVTVVYPVKVTYTEKTFYRSQTVVSENWIRIFNFSVNAFGEWKSGSAETIKRPDPKYIPREQ